MFQDTHTIENVEAREIVEAKSPATVPVATITFTTEQIEANLDAFEVAGKLDRNTAAMMRNAYRAFVTGNKREGDGIVAYWEAAEGRGKAALGKVRAQLSDAAKEVHEELGLFYNADADKYPGAVVVDGKIELAAVRITKKDPLVEYVKANKGRMTDAQKAAAIEAIKALLA
jgi:hypothetical protein